MANACRTTASPSPRHAALVFLLTACCVSSPAFAIKAIHDAISDAEKAAQNDPKGSPSIEHLQQTIDEGKQTIADLQTQSDQLEQEKTALVAQKTALEQQNSDLQARKAELERIQTALTSGLIGAIVTALVAIAGVIMKTLGSRVDRDFRRLEVVEKMAALRKDGFEPPAELVAAYGLAEIKRQV
jgi:septal ring factor EnvC (AmiA/AmiB activator)